MKTKEELNALKEEVESLSRKLAELNEDELKQVTGGVDEPLFQSSVDRHNIRRPLTENPV